MRHIVTSDRRSSPILIRLAWFGDRQPGYSPPVTSVTPYLSLSGPGSEIASQLTVSLACRQPDQATGPDPAIKIFATPRSKPAYVSQLSRRNHETITPIRFIIVITWWHLLPILFSVNNSLFLFQKRHSTYSTRATHENATSGTSNSRMSREVHKSLSTFELNEIYALLTCQTGPFVLKMLFLRSCLQASLRYWTDSQLLNSRSINSLETGVQTTGYTNLSYSEKLSVHTLMNFSCVSWTWR